MYMADKLHLYKSFRQKYWQTGSWNDLFHFWMVPANTFCFLSHFSIFIFNIFSHNLFLTLKRWSYKIKWLLFNYLKSFWKLSELKKRVLIFPLVDSYFYYVKQTPFITLVKNKTYPNSTLIFCKNPTLSRTCYK